MTVKIGSFNIQYLKTDTTGKATQEKQAFKDLKVECVAKIIANNFSIVALQEVQSLRTIEDIRNQLPGSLKNSWGIVHCDEKYQALGKYLPLEKRAELGFLYDKNTWEFVQDDVLYKGIHEGMLDAVEAFIAVASSALFASLITKAVQEEREESEAQREDDNKKQGKSKKLAGTTAIVSGAGMSSAVVARDVGRKQFLQKMIRPPLVGIFKLKSNPMKQLRVINMHSVFGHTAAARAAEALFAIEHVYPVVNNQRLSLFDRNVTAFTLLAGDFNLTHPIIEALMAKSVLKKTPGMTVLQTSPSTINCCNKEAVEKGESPDFVYADTKHDYDHFMLDRNFWMPTPGDVSIVQDDALLRPRSEKNPHTRAISDHYPIVFETNKF